ncbi:MAG: hypothetical protein MUF39_01125 [Cyclobacteriaceae bacterium]|nr:hypothetical protein [Cyclobacteriaceae bacterium]
MKKFLLTLILLLCFVAVTWAQAPKGINYQGVARNNEGKPYASQNISVRISVLKNAANGEVEYTETHKPQTNQFGLFTLVIGQGTKVSGVDFGAINWSLGNKWLQVEIDATGGSSFVLAGSQQLMSVPYALYAETSGSSTTLTAGSGIAITNNVVSNTGDADNSPTNELQNLGEVLTRGNNAGGLKITNLGAPTVNTDAATKAYVDTQSSLDLDKSITNEIQDLTLDPATDILRITNNAAATNINLTPYQQTLTYTPATNNLSISNGNNVTISTTLSQAITNGGATGANGARLQNVGTPTASTDATTKGYVDNAIATNYAFKVPYSFTNSGVAAVNQVVPFGADVYDDFNVVASNRFTATASGTYMFFVDGTLNNAGINMELRVNSTTIIPIRKQDVIIGASVFVNTMLNTMVKLNPGDFVEVYITSFVPGDNAAGHLFGYKL